MGERNLKVRKERSDKKKEIRPTLSKFHCELISRISYIVDAPIKDIGEVILKESLQNHIVMDILSEQFYHDYWHGQTLFIGSNDIASSRVRRIDGEKNRVSFRVMKNELNTLDSLSYSLNLTRNSTAALLVEIVLDETNFIHHFVSSQVNQQLDQNRRKQLSILLNELKGQSSEKDDINMLRFLSLIVNGTGKVKERIESFLDSKF